jgi:hypothetical protein
MSQTDGLNHTPKYDKYDIVLIVLGRRSTHPFQDEDDKFLQCWNMFEVAETSS